MYILIIYIFLSAVGIVFEGFHLHGKINNAVAQFKQLEEGISKLNLNVLLLFCNIILPALFFNIMYICNCYINFCFLYILFCILFYTFNCYLYFNRL